MKFSIYKKYDVSVYDEDDRFIMNAFNLHFSNKADVLMWGRLQANRNGRTFGHISISDQETSKIVRYKANGKSWD